MRLASAKTTGSAKGSPGVEHAQARIVLIALVSFLLGVGVTAFWFYFSPNRIVDNSSSQTSSAPMNGAPAVGEPAEPAVNARPPFRPSVPFHPPVDSATMAQVKQAVPNFASLSLADGEQILREAALKQFKVAAKETDTQVKQARQRVIQAQNKSAADLAAARKHLQQIQAAGTEKIQQLAAQLQSQIAALKQLKGAAH